MSSTEEGILLAALDRTIVGTALPTIVSERTSAVRRVPTCGPPSTPSASGCWSRT
ncbi:hypothetical protein ABZX77_20870 [Streptomyces sp. NPDC004237]|uniref:hypothetical protein n=1 Tax=Streptomyces sp. NPDC004237 TaxID=3154455 RepID=UPI0033A72378